jgi:small-conductance mechanosensitive channel
VAIVSSLCAGLFILIDSRYRSGDYLVVEGGERGYVTDIGMRTTRLLTRDDIQIIVPNAVMANSKIVNETGGPSAKERVRCKVSVAYGSDIDQVRALLMKLADECPDFAEEPVPRVRFRAMSDSGLDFELMGWIPEPGMRGQVLDELYTAIYKGFNSAGIEIPYPKRDVYLHHVPPPDPES